MGDQERTSQKVGQARKVFPFHWRGMILPLPPFTGSDALPSTVMRLSDASVLNTEILRFWLLARSGSVYVMAPPDALARTMRSLARALASVVIVRAAGSSCRS